MVKVIVTHEVKDFSTWKTAFDEGEGDRTNAGVRLNGLYTAHDNPNHVTISTEFPNIESVNRFLGNPNLQASMEKGGVIGKPDVLILNKVL